MSDCKFGLNCARPTCNFTHPPGWTPVIMNCPNGIVCPHQSCFKVHPQGWNWRGNNPCRAGPACTNKKCGFKH